MRRDVVTNDLERTYTVPNLALVSGTSAKRLRKEIRSGRLPAYTLGGKWPRVAWRDYLNWARSTRVIPNAHARARAAEILEREGVS